MYNPEFLSGGGEMGQRIREFDWSATPLGPVDSWPQSLRTCVRIMLTSRQPIWIGWGKELIKLYNDPYRGIVGGKHPWALGKPAAVVWKEIWGEIGPMLQTVMEKDEGTYSESQLLIMERNGYPEETYYTFSYTPITGDEGGTAGMICFNSDDTERIQAERQMRTLMQLGSRLTDSRSSQDVFKRTLRVLNDNPQDFPFVQFRMVGEEAELFHDCETAVIYRKPQVVEDIDKRVANLTKGAWEIVPHTGVILPIFHPATREAYGYLVVGINPYRLPDQKYIAFFSLVLDQITNSLADLHALEAERQRSEALMEIDRAKTLFFSNISHEFRTPLTLLLGPIEDVLSDPDAKEVNRYRMGVAYRNVLRMQKLVNTLLDFSRIEAGRMDAKFSRVDIVAFTRELASSFRSAVERAGMQLQLSSGLITEEVYVDVDQWEQIMLNLISNALKYTQEGSIAVHLEQAGDQLLVHVRDTGVGIPEDQLTKIFDRFHRVESIEGRSQEGTGIGLAMVKELVRMHHGTISVTSQLGRGSTFTIAIPIGHKHLPADRIVEPSIVGLKYAESFVTEAMKWLPSADDDTDPRMGADEDVSTNIARDGGTVLLADDNADMREYVQRLLARQFVVITATDGEDAYSKVLQYRPDLLLTDVMMPRLDGFALLEKIRSNPRVRHMPVIILSARAGEEAKVEGLATGADDYLVKPFTARELLARVEANIRLARSRSEHANLLEQEVKRQTTVLRELNVTLLQSNEDLQQFAHVASHDLKEPVRKIRTFSNRLQEEFGKMLPEKARIFLSKIEQSTQRIVMMIDGVLAYSTLNGSEQAIEPIDLNTIVAYVEADLELPIAEKKATLIRGALPQLEGAPVLIYQLFYNLINNSLKFSRPDTPPAVVIVANILHGQNVEQDGEIVELVFRDNGIGFDQEHADRIFNTFARLHARDKYEGTGLGLALCRKIVERHHGSISAAGEKDRGATFTIRLPLRQDRKNI